MQGDCKRILIVSANPETTRPLRVDDEKRGIVEGLKKSRDRDDFKIEILNSARINDFKTTMLDFKPHILHFCGHGTGDRGIIFESDNESVSYVEGKPLADYLGNFTKTLECVILNACYSEVQAQEIRKQVQYVIGMKEAIGDKIAIEFSVSFYETVFAKYEYKEAYKIACDSVKLNNSLIGSLTPVMLLREKPNLSITPEQHRARVEFYLTNLKKGCEIKLREIHSSLYPLEGMVITSEMSQQHHGAEDMDLRVPYQAFDESGEKKEREDDICKCISGTTKKVILLGEPGCGKSVSLLKLTIEFVTRALADEDELIPILIPLASYKEKITPLEYVKSRMAKDTDFVDELFNSQKCLFIFDALNEVASDRRCDVINYILGLNRYIVSCRLLDYKKEFAMQSDIARVEILDLDLLKIKDAIAHRKLTNNQGDLWFAMGGNDALITFWESLRKDGHEDWFWKSPSTTRYADFITMKDDSQTHEFDAWIAMHNKGLMPLCRNPMLLRMVYDLYLQSGAYLPENRGKLFEKFANECLDSELRKIESKGEMTAEQQRVLKRDTFLALTALAKVIITNKQGTGIRYEEGKAELLKCFNENEIAEIEKFARDSSILLADEDEYRFIHQLHQEYFASISLHDAFKNNDSATKFFNPTKWWEAEGWEESAVILAGILEREELNSYFIWLADVQSKLVIRCIENAGILGLTTKTLDVCTKSTLLEKWVSRLQSADESIRSRIYLAQSLDKLDDPRNGVGITIIGKNEQPNMEWVKSSIESLLVSKYPVTVKQYAAFVDAEDGYVNEANWNQSIESIDWFNSRKLKPILPELSNAPIVNVSWYDAQAFCKWFNKKYNDTIKLPSEDEWMSGICLPTSAQSIVTEDDLCEMNDFEKIVSVGLCDTLSGNPHIVDVGLIWEWCSNIYGQKPAELGIANPLSLPTGILKGGSWRYGDKYKSRSYRFRTYAYHAGIDIGFRVVKDVHD